MSRHEVDSKGNRSLGYFAMKAWYQNDHDSILALKNFPTHKLIFYPEICIVIWEGDLSMLGVQRIYPVGSNKKTCVPNKRAWEALRRLYRHPDKGWRVDVKPGIVIFQRRGRIKPVDYPAWGRHPLSGGVV